jgi:hypothetical protein
MAWFLHDWRPSILISRGENAACPGTARAQIQALTIDRSPQRRLVARFVVKRF